jgi:hypothetical protein
MYFYKKKPFPNSRNFNTLNDRAKLFVHLPQVTVPKYVSLMKLTEERWRVLWLRYLMYMELGHNFTRQEVREKVCGVSNRTVFFNL